MVEKAAVEAKALLAKGPVFQCVPNFSEGRRREVVEAIAKAAQEAGGVVADWSLDPDHNRSVVTILGDAARIRAAALAAARVAVQQIDMRTHTGLHPRTGAVDVLPVVPVRDATKEEAVRLAYTLGEDLAHHLGLPVFFYEWAARPGHPTALPELRRGGLESLMKNPIEPDLGPSRLHPTAGIAIVGAREPLVAYNILLNTADAAVAKALAKQIRAQRTLVPHLQGVRALGLYLPSRGKAQLSMNLTQPQKTPLIAVFHWVAQAAQALGAAPEESEIVGLIPRAALGDVSPDAILWLDYRPQKILEWWLE